MQSFTSYFRFLKEIAFAEKQADAPSRKQRAEDFGIAQRMGFAMPHNKLKGVL